MSERELPLANAMRKLDTRQRDGRGSKRLKARHGSAAAFDRAMVLLDDVVEIAATPDDDASPPCIFLAQQTQRSVARDIAIEVYFARPSWQVRGHGLSKERLRGLHAAICTK